MAMHITRGKSRQTKPAANKSEAGEGQAAEIPARSHIEAAQKAEGEGSQAGDGKEAGGKVKNPIQNRNPFIPPMPLFLAGLCLYLVTRLVGLTQFPIYFFVDEALQSQFAADLAANHYYDLNGARFPPAFRNNEYFTLGMGVYMQVLPYLLFGKSAVVTRTVSAMLSLIAAVAGGLFLRGAIKIRYWWTGVLFLSITPAWFLHSRTAWETTEFTAFYTGALCAYGFYRIKSPNYLYLAIFLSALAFYTYSPGQALVPFTALALFIFDLKYHWKNRRTIFFGALLLAILTVPYLRFRAMDPDNASAHLHNLGSYLFSDISTWGKMQQYVSHYLYGLSPWYWYIPGENTLVRHVMKGYGHIMLWTLPFALFGLVETIRRAREPAFRILLTGWLASPVAAALVEIGITRVMPFVFTTAILTALGFERSLAWIENPSKRLVDWSQAPPPSRSKGMFAAGVLLFGVAAAFLVEKTADKVALVLLTFILAVQVSGIPGTLARRIREARIFERIKGWQASPAWISGAVFLLLSGINVYMLTDALRNGPTWYTNYGMSGMQYGAFQVFEPIERYHREHPNTRILFSPNWANGTNLLARFFLGDSFPVELHSVQGYIENKLPIGDDALFIMTKEEYELAIASEKLADIRVEQTIPCPDGTNCFYFVRLRYSDAADELFAREKVLREVMQESAVKIDGEDVKIRHTYLEADDQGVSMQLVFDGNPYTYAKTYEANPFVMEITFPAPRLIGGFSIITGSARVRISLTGYAYPGAAPVAHQFEGQGSLEAPGLSFDLPEPMTAQILRIEQLDVYAVEPTKNHIWEITFR